MIQQLVGLGVHFSQSALMSKSLSKFRTAFVGVVVALQLLLLPATNVLHLGCQHSHEHGPITSVTASIEGVVENVWGWCWPSHCCDHCSERTAVADRHSEHSPPSQPLHLPHDEDSCPICQAVFAARIATTAVVNLATTEPVAELVAVDSHAVYPIPRHCVLSRGPPTGSLA